MSALALVAVAVLIGVACTWGGNGYASARRWRRLATRDPLTGLLNRRGLAQVWNATPGRDGIALIDLNRFKQINDRYGHAAGDRVLACIGQRLHDQFGDRAARLGGDEFAIVLGPGVDVTAAVTLLDPIHGVADRPLQVTYSIGCVPFVGPLVEALAAADRAMYVNKRAGRHGRREWRDANVKVVAR